MKISLHPITKFTLVITYVLISLVYYCKSAFPVFFWSFGIILLFSFSRLRKLALGSVYLILLASITLFLLYVVDLKDMTSHFTQLNTVVVYLTRISLFLSSFIISYALLDREEVYYVLSRCLPVKVVVTAIGIFYFLQVSKDNFVNNLHYQKLKLGNNWGSMRSRIKLLPLLVRNLLLSLITDLQYYAISYHNKNIGADFRRCEQLRKFSFSTYDYALLFSLTLCEVLILLWGLNNCVWK